VNSAPRLDRYSAAGEYVRYRTKVLAMLERRFPRFDPDERLELYHVAWTAVLEKRRRGDGDEIENLEAYLMGGADKLAFKRIMSADARRRVSFDPLESELSGVAADAPTPEDSAVSQDEARCVRSVIEELDPAEQAVIKLRFDVGLDPDEIRARLRLSQRQYRRLIERGSRKIVARVAALEQGERSRRQLSLLRACLIGIASDRQVAEARALLASDPKARALLRAMRRTTQSAAAGMPLPLIGAVDGTASPGRAAELLFAVREHLGDLAGPAKQQSATLYVRASDPTPLAAARPGAVAAAVAGCIAVGGGTYCAVEGIPESINPARGGKAAPQDEKPAPARATSLEVPEPVSTDAAPSTPPDGATPAPADGGQPAPPPAPATASPPPPRNREFFGGSPGGPGGDKAENTPGAASASDPSVPTPAPRTGPSEFDGP
jgi:RNA polymerase sigma factor (sigma-70 family)